MYKCVFPSRHQTTVALLQPTFKVTTHFCGAAKARAAVEKYDGKFLARGGKNIATEGETSPRTVIIEFSSYKQAENFYNSKEYQDAKSILKDKAIRQYQIVEGS